MKLSKRRFNRYVAKNRAALESAALWYTQGDVDLAEDAVQNALIAVWEFDRVEATRNLKATLAVVAKRAMKATVRRERNAQIINPMKGRRGGVAC